MDRQPAQAGRELIDIYFDFSCPYSRRTGMWWRELGEPARWRPFLLREHNRTGDAEPEWERGAALEHVSVLALALHEAVETAGGDSAAYRWSAMEAFEQGRVDQTALAELAAQAAGHALDDQQLRDGLAAVAASHQHALTLDVFGTPTLVDREHRAYLKLAQMPSQERTRSVFDALTAVLMATPEIAEIKRPS